MNLELPVSNNKTTEIDLLLIHETGLYVFEIKHYKGTIYGKDTDRTWTQYFRTEKNNTFINPIEQNRYHISAINKMYPDFPIHSIIVFTSDDCNLKVTNTDTTTDICKLKDVFNVLNYRFQQAKRHLSITDIEIFFSQLCTFSHMQDIVEINGTEAPFISWLQPTIENLTTAKNKFEQSKELIESNHAKSQQKTSLIIFLNIILTIVCLFLTFTTIHRNNTNNEALIANNKVVTSFNQALSQTTKIENESIIDLNSYIFVSDVNLIQSSNNTVSFTAKLNTTTDNFGIIIQEDAKYVIKTNSGKIYEHAVFGENLPYSEISNTLGNGYGISGNLARVIFKEIESTKDIDYIKLSGIQLIEINKNKTIIEDDLVLELYYQQND